MNYKIKTVNELTENEIEHILKLWNIPAWNDMKAEFFRTFFKNSEFHFLFDGENIFAILRLNFEFHLEIDHKDYQFAETVGLVSSEKKKGFGKILIQHFKENIQKRNFEVIGFCDAELRPFYEKCDIQILHDKGRLIKENIGNKWINSSDDDILIFNVSKEKMELLTQISENNTYLKEKQNEL